MISISSQRLHGINFRGVPPAGFIASSVSQIAKARMSTIAAPTPPGLLYLIQILRNRQPVYQLHPTSQLPQCLLCLLHPQLSTLFMRRQDKVLLQHPVADIHPVLTRQRRVRVGDFSNVHDETGLDTKDCIRRLIGITPNI